jgi:hypothetical protein
VSGYRQSNGSFGASRRKSPMAKSSTSWGQCSTPYSPALTGQVVVGIGSGFPGTFMRARYLSGASWWFLITRTAPISKTFESTLMRRRGASSTETVSAVNAGVSNLPSEDVPR